MVDALYRHDQFMFRQDNKTNLNANNANVFAICLILDDTDGLIVGFYTTYSVCLEIVKFWLI